MKDRILILAVLAIMLVAVGCHKGAEGSLPAGPRKRVVVYQVKSEPRIGSERLPGTVRSRVRASIEAKISGQIVSLPVNEGQAVQAGEVLLELDRREIKARLEQAQTVAAQAERDLVRYTGLLAQKAAAQADYESVEAKAKVARAAVSEIQTQLDYSIITAPFAGVVTSKLAEVGDLAAPGRPLLELEDPASLRFEAGVPEMLVGTLHLGMTCEVTISPGSEVLLAKVVEIAPTANVSSRTFLVKFELPTKTPSGATLRAGLYGHVVVPVQLAESLVVPQESVIKRGQLELVMVVNQQRAWLRLVRSGITSKGQIEILSGLSTGEEIVTSGAETQPGDLQDGQPVEVLP